MEARCAEGSTGEGALPPPGEARWVPAGGMAQEKSEQFCLATPADWLQREESGDKQGGAQGEPLRHTQFQNRDAQNIHMNRERDKMIGIILLSEPDKNERRGGGGFGPEHVARL